MRDTDSVTEASDALRKAWEFVSEASGPPESEEEQERFTSTLHALDEASRLVEVAGEKDEIGSARSGSEDAHAAKLCAEAMRNAALIAGEVDVLPDIPRTTIRDEAPDGQNEIATGGASTEHALVELERCANALRELQRAHRKKTFSSVAGGAVSGDEAMTRVDSVRRLDALAHHAWRCAAHLVG